MPGPFPPTSTVEAKCPGYEVDDLLKCHYVGKIVCPMLILVSFNFKMRKKGVLGFSIFYLVLEISRFLTYAKSFTQSFTHTILDSFCAGT